MRCLSNAMKTVSRMIIVALALTFAFVIASAATADGATISITPDTTFTQKDTFVVLTVESDGEFTTASNNGLKGIHMVLGFSPTVVEPDTTGGAYQPIEPGALFPTGDSVTFIWDYFVSTTGELTVDIFFLPDTQTIEGPGELLRFQMNTKNFGQTQVKFLELTLRDNLNRNISHQSNGAFVRVCQFPGDVNADNTVDPVDLSYFVDFLFNSGPPPIPFVAGDINCDGSASDPVDLSAFVDFHYSGGEICTDCL